MFSAIVSTNTKTHLSGIAKFSNTIAQKVNIPLYSFNEITKIKKNTHVLLSISLENINAELETQTWRFLTLAQEQKIDFSIFFHCFLDTPLEHMLISRAKKIYAGNREIAEYIRPYFSAVKTLWAPSLVDYEKNGKKHEINILSFGMAFKIQPNYHKILAEKLAKYNVDYIVRFSTGFHERASFGDYDSIVSDLEEIYGNKSHFYGFLSDDAIDYFLKISDLYVNFYSKGTRGNNTTLYASLERGKPVLTNFDHYSPKWLRHGINILDISKLSKKNLRKDALKKIGTQGRSDMMKNSTWDKLILALRS